MNKKIIFIARHFELNFLCELTVMKARQKKHAFHCRSLEYLQITVF